MKYHQLTSQERYAISALKRQGCSQAGIARILERSPSTISRELRRNTRDGFYRPFEADEQCRGRRSRSRRNQHFGPREWKIVDRYLGKLWSPDQIAKRLQLRGICSISHQTIYSHVWHDRACGGLLHSFLRQYNKQLRKRYGRYDSRGRLAGKRHISERPAAANDRSDFGHFEADTVMGARDKHCLVTLVDRKSGYTLTGKLPNRTVTELNRRLIQLISHSAIPVKTITFDNGTEFHGYTDIEEASGVTVYFATPHHSWERGTNENTNGLIRQYAPRGHSLLHTTQYDCNRISRELNSRPRKRLGYLTPLEFYAEYAI